MKIIIYLTMLSIWVSCNDIFAQVPGSNPIFTNAWTADPAPMVYNGRMYVYVGHDEATGNQLYNITGWLCYSTADMKTWTYHGQVLKPTDFSWSTGEAWASQVVEQNGKFYYYVCCQAGGANTGKAIGVAVSNSPTGPFVDARGTALVYDKTTPSANAWDDIDPTILKDDDGSVYMVWGNPNCYFAKLKPNMTEIDGAIKTITPPNYAEGPWLHKRNGIYYLTYAAFVPGVGSEQICYATASNINGPWTYKGVLSGTAKNSYTIHPGIIEYNNQWYLFYHNATLTINGVGPTTGRRSVCVDYLCYNSDGTMKPVTQTTSGVSGSSPCPSSPSPVVSITAPTNNTVYTEGDNVTLNATATITTGSISKVDFYNGTTLLGTDASSPYTYTITGAAAGNYAITAKATSALNAATTSTAINIQIAKPIYQTGSVPTIDGTIDALWSNFNSVSIAKNNTGTVSSTADLSGNWKAAWDATNLYVLVQVTDDVKRNDAGTDVYNDDGVEVYIDMGNSKSTTYGTNDQQYTFRWNDATAAYEINGHSVTGITKSITNTATGYIVEVRIPWSTMGGTASVNAIEGFEVMISDDDDGAARDGKLAWAASTDDTWSNPSLMGTVILKGLNCSAPTAAITTTTSTSICAGSSVILNASTGTGYSYVWKNGTTTITGATSAAYTATTAGTYTVSITNAGGCSATSAATTVTVNALPTLTQYAQIDGGAWNQVSTATVCAGSTIVLGPQPTVNTGWSWAGPNGYSATTREITLASATTNQGGVYTATYTDGNTCKATSTFTLTVNALPTAAITTTTPTSFCTGGSVVLTASTGSSYKWMNGTTQVGTNQSYTVTTAGSYTVEVTNVGNCKATSTATTVTVNSLPTAAITTTTATTFCQGGSVVLTASSGSSYKWMNGTTAITGATAAAYTATTSGSYTVEVTNAGNCKATSTATTVTVNAAPTAAITTTTPTTFCTGGSVVLTVSSGSSYKWMNGTTAITGATVQSYTATTAGSYTVEVTNAGNCKATSAATTVTVNTLPTATITANGSTSIPQGGNVVLTANTGSGFTYKWFKGSVQVGTAQTYTATDAGVYTVEVTNANNCSATSSGTNVNVNTNQPSVITITSPVANTTVQGTITIAADVTDPDGTIAAVEFLDGNMVIGTSTTAPYSFDWNNPGQGSHTITVRVTDSNGGITTSAPVTITAEAITTGVQSSNTLDAVVYPNPSRGDVYIETDVDLSNASFTIVDVLGREVQLESTLTGSGAMVDISNLNEGAYVMIIKNGNLILRKKITVIK
ncbi:sugar-binding protein [Cytophaga aurantiaca]|uniref:sugar-binding protein n=1 Tax=Cytophaga aurantiaca TaxID=29530 RepID=UPI00037BCE11|nr:sugar-binding protein [Cytophaga aurantiaca]